jgi:hypothetical protein
VKDVVKVNAKARQSGAVTKSSLESMAQDDDFQNVKRRKRHICNDTSQTAKKSTISVPKSTGKLPTEVVITRNFFGHLRTNDMDTETTGTENNLPEEEAPRKSGRSPPIVMTPTTNIIRIQSDLKDHVKGEYEFRNTRNGTRIITKEVADSSVMKPYLEENNLQYFISSPNSEKPIKAVTHHLPPHTPAEDISNSLEDLGFNVINVRQLTTSRRTPNGQTHVETLPLFLVTLTRKAKSQDIFKLNCLNHIIMKIELCRAQTGLAQCYSCQNFVRVWANCK